MWDNYYWFDSEEEYNFYLKNFDWQYATYEEYLEWCNYFGYTPEEIGGE